MNSLTLNFFPLRGHSHLSLPSSWVLANTNFSTSCSGSFRPIFPASSSDRVSFTLNRGSSFSSNVFCHWDTVGGERGARDLGGFSEGRETDGYRRRVGGRLLIGQHHYPLRGSPCWEGWAPVRASDHSGWASRPRSGTRTSCSSRWNVPHAGRTAAGPAPEVRVQVRVSEVQVRVREIGRAHV